jgi:hypothetical protein
MKNLLFSILCAAACLPALGNPASFTPPAFPDTRVAALAKEYMSLCRAPSLDRFTQWISANFDGVTDSIVTLSNFDSPAAMYPEIIAGSLLAAKLQLSN